MLFTYLEFVVPLGRDAIRYIPVLRALGVGVAPVVNIPDLDRIRKIWLAQVVGIRLHVDGRGRGERNSLCGRFQNLIEPYLTRDEAGYLHPVGADPASRGEVHELVGRFSFPDNTIPVVINFIVRSEMNKSAYNYVRGAFFDNRQCARASLVLCHSLVLKPNVSWRRRRHGTAFAATKYGAAMPTDEDDQGDLFFFNNPA